MGNSEQSYNQIEEKRSYSQFSDRYHHQLSNISYSSNLSSQYLPKTFKTFILPPNITIYDDVTKKYNIYQEEIGTGITAKVFLATNSNGEKFAIKRIIKSKIYDRERIIREAEISMRLKHKNILNYYEIYEDNFYISYVMEYGTMDLFDFISKCPLGKFPDKVAIDLLIQILNAIIYLHENSIIHCDIKPENFIVVFDKTNNPIVKLLDFGNAIFKNKYKIKSQYFKGTEFYKAPETFGNSVFNEKVDEWGVGVIMYIMLTGGVPFEEGGNMENNIKNKKINFEKISNQKLREINEKLLCRDFEKRISAREGVMKLRNIKNNVGGIRYNTEFNINKTKIPRENFDYGGVGFLFNTIQIDC